MKKAFTIVELLIVVAIIGLLTSMAVSFYKEYLVESKKRVLQSNLILMRKAINRYQAANLRSPKKLVDLLTVGLQKIPIDPFRHDNDYQMRVATNSVSFLWKASNHSFILSWGFDDIRSLATFPINVQDL